ncbi:MAG TPA: hypothetical protein VEB68_02520 [Croceibacterium sp.]|nr:hypothetical protein [Croceibacterium sp.]
MSPPKRISSPSGYVAPTAVGFADEQDELVLVSADSPLPTAIIRGQAPQPLAGLASESVVAGPFAPLPDAPLHLQLSGSWTGRAELQRSTDGGATRTALTAGGLPWARFEGNANEAVWQESERGATFYLDIVLTSGTLGYRLSQ